MATPLSLIQRIQFALTEDAPNGDITSQFMINSTHESMAHIIAKQKGIFYGEKIIYAFNTIHKESLVITNLKKDGESFNNQTVLLKLEGNTQTILLVERVLLNLLQRCCGIATTTQNMVQALNNKTIDILDTRKTSPLWRDLEKEAVLAGGGKNHRESLSDMMLIKENHIKHGIKDPESFHLNLKAHKKKHPHIQIEIEINTLSQLENLRFDYVDYILLDNFSLKELDQAIFLCEKNAPHAKIEISGNISQKSILSLSDKKIHRISCGALTHSVKACDLSLLIL